jgi:NAD+ synthetase
MPVIDAQALIADRVGAISEYHRQTGLSRAELDLSGGVDSATMAALLALSLGTDQITLVYSSIGSGEETRSRASALAEAMGIPLVIHDLTPTYEAMVTAMVDNLVTIGWERSELEERMSADPTILGSIRSCLRAPLGRGYSRLTGNGIRHGTGNECEDRWLRFYQKGGDGEVDTNPISMLSKGEVFQLARALGARLDCADAIGRIIAAPPTPELWGADVAHTDEDEIGSYLGLEHTGHSFYSYIDLQTGDYARVGLIERVARLVDLPAGRGLFDDGCTQEDLQRTIEAAASAPPMAGVDRGLIDALLRAARRAERVTRHKHNPACPTLGSRAAMVAQGLLTDTLPVAAE